MRGRHFDPINEWSRQAGRAPPPIDGPLGPRQPNSYCSDPRPSTLMAPRYRFSYGYIVSVKRIGRSATDSAMETSQGATKVGRGLPGSQTAEFRCVFDRFPVSPSNFNDRYNGRPLKCLRYCGQWYLSMSSNIDQLGANMRLWRFSDLRGDSMVRPLAFSEYLCSLSKL